MLPRLWVTRVSSTSATEADVGGKILHEQRVGQLSIAAQFDPFERHVAALEKVAYRVAMGAAHVSMAPDFICQEPALEKDETYPPHGRRIAGVGLSRSCGILLALCRHFQNVDVQLGCSEAVVGRKQGPCPCPAIQTHEFKHRDQEIVVQPE